MTVKSGQSVTVLFATADATSGAAADATVGPVGTLYVDGTASAATVTVANITTGLYKAIVTLPTLTAGQIVSLRIAATVGVAGEGVVWQDGADTTLVSDLAAVLPSAAAGTAGGLPVLGSNAADMTLNIAGNLTGTVNGLTSAAQANVRTAVGLANADLDTQLSSAATAISGVAAAVDVELSSVHGAGLWGGASGSGTGTYTDTVTDGTNPIDGVRVVLYTDAAMTAVAYEAYTNALGVFTMYPDPGTYYRKLEGAGYTFTQGVEVTVT